MNLFVVSVVVFFCVVLYRFSISLSSNTLFKWLTSDSMIARCRRRHILRLFAFVFTTLNWIEFDSIYAFINYLSLILKMFFVFVFVFYY